MVSSDVFKKAPKIETMRLVLRQMSLEDAQEIFSFQSDPEALRYYCQDAFTHVDQTNDYIQRALKAQSQQQRLAWSILLRANQQLIGRIHLSDWSYKHHCAELNYMLARPYWGQGYMSEALYALIRFAFTETTLNRIEAHCWSENIGSARVLEKVGMQLEGTYRQRLFCKGSYQSVKTYAFLRQDYLMRRESK